ncbi:hypothetical protein SDC9_36724 [bioreactor metagenome]|uniref:Fluoroacetyl-CoA-specific thioesterase-like domain-containing protein n=1 Tax=bioreactor metagenome TaxID=1076179 RepID=A0A644VH10_9ZZZZ
MNFDIGIRGRSETVVTFENTAAAVGSGLVPVFATPHMIAMMENASVDALAPYMDEGQGSVGTFINVTHDAATPIGMKVWAESQLIEKNGKALTFSVTAYDEAGVIGKGTHGRYIIDYKRFVEKAAQKKAGV